MNCIRYMTSTEPVTVTSAKPAVFSSKTRPASNIDEGMTAEVTFSNDATGLVVCHLRNPPSYYFIPKMPEFLLTVQCEGGELKLYNFVMPTFYHYIEVSMKTGKDGKGRKKRVEKVYKPTEAGVKGEEWWTT